MKEKKIELHKGGFGTAALVLGICGLFVFPFILSILAIVFGSIGMNRNEKHAKTGMILGIFGFVFAVLLLVLFMSIFMAAFASVF